MYLGGFNQFGEQMCIRWYFTFIVIIIFHILTPEKILLMKEKESRPLNTFATAPPESPGRKHST